MIAFETPRLILRCLLPSDLEDLFRLYGDAETMQYIEGGSRSFEKTRQYLEKHIRDLERYGFCLYAAIYKPDGKFIGRCGLEAVETPLGLDGDIAWMFEAAYRGQGLATEFGAAMLAYTWQRLPVRRVFATADPLNLASIQVMQKLGMRCLKVDEWEVEYEAWPSHPTA